MRRMLWAGLLALPALFAFADQAKAQGCSTCGPFVGSGRPAGWAGQGPFGCGGFCLRLFGSTLQDGPLVNYGPYEGYYPFEPYGPWTSDLRYTGPTSRFQSGAGSCNSCGLAGCGGRCGGLGWGGLQYKRACGDYAMATFRNVFHRCNPCVTGCGTTSPSTAPGGCGN